jgi:hypothetical protein
MHHTQKDAKTEETPYSTPIFASCRLISYFYILTYHLMWLTGPPPPNTALKASLNIVISDFQIKDFVTSSSFMAQ